MMKLKPWTIALAGLIVADSALTSYVVAAGLAVESNPLINWFMATFSLDISVAMILRTVILLPCLAVINTTAYSKHVMIAYILIYFIGVS
jgi:hypothetical protein